MKKRPFASEGHLRLPLHLAPVRASTSQKAPSQAPDPEGAPMEGSANRRSGAELELLGPAPFDPAGGTRTAQVLGDAMAAHGVCAGDHVVLAPRREPEFGDLVALGVALRDTHATLWKAYPESGVLHLRCGDERLSLAPDAPIAGVVVAVRRALTP